MKRNFKKECAVVLFGNSKYFFALAVFLINLKQYFHRYDNVIVYTDDISYDQIEILKKIENKLIVDRYTREEFDREFVKSSKDDFFLRRFSHLVVSKFVLFKYLDEFRKIIYFDVDMVIRGNIDELIYGDYNIAGAVNKDTILDRVERYSKDKIEVQRYLSEIEGTGVYQNYLKGKSYNGGLFVINDNFDYLKAYETCKTFALNTFSVHPYLFDELMFGYVISEMKLNVHNFDRSIYNTLPVDRDLSYDSKIIHLYSTYKPWSNKNIQLLFYDWVANYKIYKLLAPNIKDDVKLFNLGTEFNLLESYEQANDNIKMWSPIVNSFIKVLPENITVNLNLSKQYVQLYIDNVDKRIHYEIRSKGKEFYVCLHCEIRSPREHIEQLFESICDNLNIKKTLMIEKKVKLENIREALLDLIDNSKVINKLNNC